MPATPPLLLASTSRYREALLARLGLPFASERPGVAESARPGEAPGDLARRLAAEKASAVAKRHPGAVVIGSDQVAECRGEALGKPGTPERARAQLEAASGSVVTFHTAVAVASAAGLAAHTDVTRVRFRRLSAAEIARYVDLESPLDCAGSFKSEGLGIALFEAIETVDPTALVGLPLIWVARALAAAGLDALAPR